MLLSFLKRVTSSGESGGDGDNAFPDREPRRLADRPPAASPSPKADEIVELLDAREGRVKQADIVAATEWSKATVSRVLSRMESNGTIRKISVGRENVITLVGAEPDWYSAPEPSTNGDPADDHLDPILLVEDNPADARVLKEACEDAGIANPIHVVQDGSDAIDFVMQRDRYAEMPRPGLVLLDLSLRVVDGTAVLEEFDGQQAVRDVPLLVFSRSAAPEDVRAAYENGADAYLTKPDGYAELVDLAETIQSFWLSRVVRPSQVPSGSA